VTVAAAEHAPRVLLVVDNLEIGGPQSVAVSSATGLRARGLDVRVAHLGIRNPHLPPNEVRAHGVPTLNLGLGSLLDPRAMVGLARHLRRARIDLLHTHCRYASLVGRAAAAMAGRPSVSTIHHIVETDSGWRGAVRRQLDHLSARTLCSAVITVSDEQRRVYERTALLKARRVETHRNGVDTERFRPDLPARTRLRTTLGVEAATPLFVTVAILRPGKGLRYLLEAAVLMRERAPAARFVVVGDGEERAGLEALAAALGLTDMLCFTGLRTDIPALLAAADVYVHPSLFEALPMSVLEAMAVGLPVVATRVGGVPEVVKDGETGLLVRPASAHDLAAAMSRLLDPARRTAMGAAARAWVQANASTSVWLDRLQELYCQVARERAPLTRK
jgi:glycosyltransferase involved in cell wall biosynthesis